jgi:hypothetical protein
MVFFFLRCVQAVISERKSVEDSRKIFATDHKEGDRATLFFKKKLVLVRAVYCLKCLNPQEQNLFLFHVLRKGLNCLLVWKLVIPPPHSPLTESLQTGLKSYPPLPLKI